ncbi:MAG: hypothetical protein LBK67_11575 [Coriobacteriales bacterium]|jgi:hypothetical protein|nr:hypothetical protein [Coriobacteriales bacterium]
MKRINTVGATRVISLLMGLLLSLSLVACKTAEPDGRITTEEPAIGQSVGGRAAYELWEVANKSREEAESISFELDYQMTLANVEPSKGIEMSMSGPIQMASQGSDDAQMALDLRVVAMGQNLSMQAWYKDGYYYYSLLGMKLKQAMSTQDALSQNSFTFLSFSESAIKEQSLSDTPDGGKRLSFLLDGTQTTELVEDLLASGAQSSGLDLGSLDIATHDITVIAVVDQNDRLSECTYGFDINMPADTGWTTAACHVAMTQIRYDNLSIVFPNNLDSYTEAPL